MPDLNLNEEGAMEEQTPSEEPTQPELSLPSHRAGGQATRMVIILVSLGVLVGVVYMLNKLGIVKLWSTGEPTVAHVQDQLPPQEQMPLPSEQQQPAQQEPAKAEPKKEEPQPSAKEPAKAADQATARQEQQTEPKAPETTPAVTTPPIETKPAQTGPEAAKASESPKLAFRLKDPIVFSSKPRAEQATVAPVAPAKKEEEPPIKPKVEPKPKEVLPVQKMTAPLSQKVESPTSATPTQHQAQTPTQTVSPKHEDPAQKKPAETKPAEPKKETAAAATPKKEPTPAQAATPPKPAPATAGEMKGTYTVQVYALRDKGNAEAVVRRLSDGGYPAFLEPIEARGMTWYTVRIGRYASHAEAKKAVESFAQEIKVHHFIDKVRSK